MARDIGDVATLQQYLRGVLERAEHHAKDVDEIALAVLGAVLWRNDKLELEVKEYNGETANVLWVNISGNRYALSYRHGPPGAIEVRERSVRGNVLKAFTNTTPIADVKRFFGAL